MVDIDVSRVGNSDTVGTYVFDVNGIADIHELRRTLHFSRKLLLQEVAKRGFNVLLTERSADRPLFLSYANMSGSSTAGTLLFFGRADVTGSRFVMEGDLPELSGQSRRAARRHSSTSLA